ncbi:MAG: hypothetical protein QNK65_03110 [Flavobacteriales bacterium]
MKTEESEDGDIISKPFSLTIKSLHNYITPGDNIGHFDNANYQTNLAFEVLNAEVGGHICTLRTR